MNRRPDREQVAALAAYASAALLLTLISASVSSIDPVIAGVIVLGGVVGGALFFTPRCEISLAIVGAYVLLLDGYLKLRFPGQLTTLGRDALLYALVAGAVIRLALSGARIQLPPLSGWVIAWVLIFVAQLANPANGSMAHNLQSLRPHLEFVPLFVFGYLLLRTRRRIELFLWFLVVTATINGLVALVQILISPDQLAGWGPGYAEKLKGTDVVSARGFVDTAGVTRNRPFGLGNDQGFGGTLGLLAVPAALALLSLTRTRPILLTLATAGAAGTALAVVTSQARVVILGSVAVGLIYVILANRDRRRISTFVGIALAVCMLFFILSAIVDRSGTHVLDRYRTIAPSTVVDTTVDYRKDTLALVPKYVVEIPLGGGLGTVGPAASVPGGNGRTFDAESEFTYLLAEGGLAAMIIFCGFVGHLCLLVIRRWPRLQDTEANVALSAIAAPIFGLVLVATAGSISASPPTSPYIFFVAGALSWWLVSRVDGAQHR
jgi:hypothetical protein